MTNPFAISVRFLKAINLLASPKGTTIKRIMETLCISRRSAFRLIQALEELGFPITDSQPNHKTEKLYSLAESYVLKLPNITIPNPSLTAEEIINVLAILDTNKKYNLLINFPIINSAREKLLAMLPIPKKE